MKRMIGLLMVVGIMVGVVGCGDDDNPVKSSHEDLLVGTWEDQEDGGWITFSSDGTQVESFEAIELPGTWSLVGDQLKITQSIEDLRDPLNTLLAIILEVPPEEVSDAMIDEFIQDFFPDANDFVVITYTLNSITDTELTVTDEYGERWVKTRKMGTAVISSTWGEIKASAHP